MTKEPSPGAYAPAFCNYYISGIISGLPRRLLQRVQERIGAVFLIAALLLSGDICLAEEDESAAQGAAITEILINGSTFQQPLQDLAGSARVISQKELKDRALSSFSQTIGAIPGLQWAGGTALPRFFQIRGIGELEQYQGAPNPSVGVIIDDIDYSGLGMIVPLFDVEQIEVLKGPQGIRYGSSALAGVINLQSNPATSLTSGMVEIRAGNDDLHSGSFAVGGAVPGTNDKLQLRIASSHTHQDGFRDNQFLNRDDTNERDLHMTRLKLHADPSDTVGIDLAGLLVDNNNGFDAFSIDNSLKTQSDKPGADQLESRAGSLAVQWKADTDLTLKSISSYSRTNIDYSYDGDWGNNPFWEPYAPYDYFSATDRTRSTASQEFRLTHQAHQFVHDQDWKESVGLFFQRLNEQGTIEDSADEQIYNSIDSDYRARTGALFGEFGIPLGHGRSLEIGGRIEQRHMRYRDDRPSSFTPENTMWASHLALKQDITSQFQSYVQLSRGFKGGGFNPGTRVPTERRIYDPESQWNMEIGLKGSALSKRLNFDAAVFHALRRNAQLKFAFQDDPSDPLSFTYLTESTARGRSTGLESSLQFRVTPRWSLFSNGMIMESAYTAVPVEVSSLAGRSYSHAPNWQYSAGTIYNITESIFLQSDMSRQGAFYFDDSHNQKSTPFSLLNLSAGVRYASWSWTVWWKNVMDENYPVRGFFFGNEPPDFSARKYVQRGDPSFFGTTLTYSF